MQFSSDNCVLRCKNNCFEIAVIIPSSFWCETNYRSVLLGAPCSNFTLQSEIHEYLHFMFSKFLHQVPQSKTNKLPPPPPTIKMACILNARIFVLANEVTEMRTFKNEPFFIVGGGAYSWYFTVYCHFLSSSDVTLKQPYLVAGLLLPAQLMPNYCLRSGHQLCWEQ